MSRGFGKYRRGTTHHSFHFDTLFKENSNRPSAARSAASVGKWGITSFTSIRTLNGRQENETSSNTADSAPKPKKFFKSRDSSQDANSTTSPSYQSPASYSPASKKARTTYEPSDRKTRGNTSPKKFFSSKNSSQEKVVLTLNTASKRRNSDRSDTSEPSKPPIVLRICRGKSQLVNDTDESEKTVTPSSTPSTSASTSPRALRETSNSQVSNRPSNCRITRSARRSMQQDPSSSPATADTPAEFTIFSPTSKKESLDIDLSPQYVPAEKFEEERRALYASLLKPDSPNPMVKMEEEDLISAQDQEELQESTAEENNQNDLVRNNSNGSVEEAMAELHGLQSGDSPEEDEVKQDVEKQPLDIEVELGEIVSKAVEDTSLDMKKEDSVSEEELNKDEIKDTTEIKDNAGKTKSSLEKNTGETLETIENIAKEIENTVTVKSPPVRELRRRTRQKELKETPVSEPPKETISVVTRPGLRAGLRNRNKNVSTKEINEEIVGKLLEENEIVTKEKAKVTKERTVKEKEKLTKVKEKAVKEKEKVAKEKKKVIAKEKEEMLIEEEKATEEKQQEIKEDEEVKEVKEKEFPVAEEEVSVPVVEEVVPVPVIPEVEETSNVMSSKEAVERNIEEDWSTDSDSNSTSPEMEVKQIVPDPELLINEIERHKDKILDKILEKPPEPPPVKLVISKKKGSIFKSRALVDDASKKRRARYVHKWIDDKDGKGGGETPARPHPENADLEGEFTFKDEPLTRVTEIVDDQDKTSVKCAKSDKGYYMIVRNVKKAHQIQEIGEFQEFNDDVEYILDALQESSPLSTRCLSAITLASKCMVPAFRMHVRAHGIVAKFFKALHDATKDQSLGLCTATVMFVLSQDRLNMDLDRDCLELMLNLLESDVSYQQALDVCGLTTSQLEKNKQKVRELCGEIQSQGHAMHLNLENITTGQLAMETLLSLTSKRAGEWFKEELRELGGLEHIMKTIHECCRQVSDYVVSWTDALLDKLKKVDRCLRVLENVTQNNEENQTYILKYNDGMMIETLVSLYKLCDGEIPLYPVTDISDKVSTGAIIREALLVTLKVLINLTHHYRQQSIGSQLVGGRSGIIETSLHLLLQVPNYIPEQKKFELGVLVLMLLINLIQDQDSNKKLLIEAKAPSKLESIYSREEGAVEALIVQFYDWEACAKIAENKTNAILDGEKDVEDTSHTPNKSSEEFIEETVAKLLQKAGTHMEYTFLASYIVMLVGFLIMENPVYQDNIRQFLRGSNFNDMVELLKKFFNFMNLTASTEASSVCAVKATERVIKFLEECDKKEDSDLGAEQKEPLDIVDRPYL